ncbi:MAG TPA: caspase family protein [Myxococcales bacterium]|nr:caspase family protein [Myxococcales bacterium]
MRPPPFTSPRVAPWLAAAALWCAPAAAPAVPAELEPVPRTAVHRVALLAGVNDGGPERLRLRYAASDAQAFGAVLRELGGVAEPDVVPVMEGDRKGLLAGLEQLSGLARRWRGRATRVEAIVYYSGHSDEQGLLLRGEHLDYGELRRALERVDADVKLVVLDSCASGALARRKGLLKRPPFLQDESARIHGMAILTSSAEDEVSQESERLRGSFFTHHLISALRGAADVNGDGRVTLSEAYELAYRETLSRTESTQGGVQHATYDMDLSGSGELVLTDLRASTAGLVLAAGLDGRIFVRDTAGGLAAEVSKKGGARIELGLPRGRYSVRREWPQGSALADVTLRDGERRPLEDADFIRTLAEATTARGDAPGLRRVPFNLSLLPGVGTNDLLPEAAENAVALGLYTRSAALGGTALGFFGTWVDQEARFFQGSLFTNYAGGPMTGAQFSLGVNWAGGSVQGAQVVSLLAFAQSDVRGVQLSPAVALAGGSVRGLQLGGFLAGAGASSSGAQISLALNVARAGWTGAQISLTNLADAPVGLQLGLVNVARHATGVQLGLVNVSDDIDGAPVGVVNVVRNGQLHGEAYADDVEPVNVAIKMGSRRVFSTIFVGGGRSQTFRYGVSVGLHVGDRLWADFDGGCSGLHTVAEPLVYTNTLSFGRAVVGWQVWPQLAVFGGASANVFIRYVPEAPAQASYFPPLFILAGGVVNIWPGLILGARL